MTVAELITELMACDASLPVLVATPASKLNVPYLWYQPVQVKPDENRLILNCEPL